MSIAPRFALSRWSLSALLFGVLLVALLPLGILAMLLTMADYRAAMVDPTGTLTGMQWLQLALPSLLWILAFCGGWVALRALTVLPVRRLQHLFEPSRGGDDESGYGSRDVTKLAETIVVLATEVIRHNDELDIALAEQRRLTREVHHRVKNSLQIVSSLMSLHARGLSTPAIVATYAAMQARVSALTMVHRWIYDERSLGGVDLRALAADLAGALELSLAGPENRVVTINRRNITALNICPDAAIPVAFLITELSSIAVQVSDSGRVELVIDVSRAGDIVTLAVGAAVFGVADCLADKANTASARIVHGMARQLRSKLNHVPATGQYSISFTDISH